MIYKPIFAARLKIRLDGGDSELPILLDNEDAGASYNPESFDDSDWVVAPYAVPSSFDLNNNDMTNADTMTIKFRFSDMPIDPGVIRAIEVSLYGFLADDESYGEGLSTGKNRPVCPMNDQTWLFTGYAESESISIDDGIITLEVQDYQNLLMGTQILPSVLAALPDSYDAQTMVEFILRSNPVTCGIKVESLNDAGKVMLANSKFEKAVRSERYEDLWSFLTNQLLSAGIVPYMYQDTIYLVFAGDIYALYEELLKRRGVNLKDPWVFVNGYNIEGLEITRDLSTQAAPPVKVTLWDGTASYPSEQFPPEEWLKKHPARVSASGADCLPREFKLPFKQYQNENLLDIAKGLFNMLSRGERVISFKTNELVSFNGDEWFPDVLWLRAGFPITVLDKVDKPGDAKPDKGQVADDVASLKAMDVMEMKAYLESKGFKPELAAKMARAIKTGMPNQYKVRNISISHDGGQDGYGGSTSITINAAEYAYVKDGFEQL